MTTSRRAAAMFLLMVAGSATTSLTSLSLNRGWTGPLAATAFIGPLIAGVATSFYVTTTTWRERITLAVVQGVAHSIGTLSIHAIITMTR